MREGIREEWWSLTTYSKKIGWGAKADLPRSELL